MNNLRKCFLLLTGIFFTANLWAQETTPVLATIHYNFIHVNDTTQRNKHHEEQMVLYIGKEASLYDSDAGKALNEQLVKQAKDPAFDGNLTIVGQGSTNESYYRQAAKRIFKVVHKLGGRQYVLDEDYPSAEWQISEETKEIGGYTCQRANTHFKGRDYIVWFAPDLPFAYGPWELSGLPGLILEAADSRNEVVFHYSGFDKVPEGDLEFSLPTDLIKTDKEAFLKLQKAFQENPSSVMNAGAAGRATMTKLVSGKNDDATSQINQLIDPNKIKSISIIKADPKRVSKVTNNPIALTD